MAALLAVVALSPASAPASAKESRYALDGLYDYVARGQAGTLAAKVVKGGIAFEVATAQAQTGKTCAAKGVAVGGTAGIFREGNAGFKIAYDRGQIALVGLTGQPTEAKYCAAGATMAGLYRRRGPLDAATTRRLESLAAAAVTRP